MLLFYCLWFYILGSRKLALDLDYRLDNELKSIMTQLVICIFLARFVQFALNLWLFLMMLFALMSCGVHSHSGFTTLSRKAFYLQIHYLSLMLYSRILWTYTFTSSGRTINMITALKRYKVNVARNGKQQTLVSNKKQDDWIRTLFIDRYTNTMPCPIINRVPCLDGYPVVPPESQTARDLSARTSKSLRRCICRLIYEFCRVL